MPVVMSAVSLRIRITEAAATRPGGGMIGTIFIYFFSQVSLTILTNRESSELVAECIFCALQVRTRTI